jgi:Holliday junction DNA helicase RuvB
MDRQILLPILKNTTAGGLDTWLRPSARQDTLEDVYEPYLMQCGFLKRAPRRCTNRATEYLPSLPEQGSTHFV